MPRERALRLLRGAISDMLLLGGTASMVYAIALVHVPAAWGFAGLVAALAGQRLGRRR